jgi:sulfur relay protein TusB/DsrH
LTIYLVDEPYLDIAAAYARMEKGARVVLLQDAVYSALSGRIPVEAYALEQDVARRGLGSRVPKSVKVIGYSELVQMMEKDRVVNFL